MSAWVLMWLLVTPDGGAVAPTPLPSPQKAAPQVVLNPEDEALVKELELLEVLDEAKQLDLLEELSREP